MHNFHGKWYSRIYKQPKWRTNNEFNLFETGNAADVPAIMPIIANAKALLKADGSPQWQDGSPRRSGHQTRHYAQQSWLLMVDGQVAGTAAQVVGDDPNYHDIDGEGWLTRRRPTPRFTGLP